MSNPLEFRPTVGGLRLHSSQETKQPAPQVVPSVDELAKKSIENLIKGSESPKKRNYEQIADENLNVNLPIVKKPRIELSDPLDLTPHVNFIFKDVNVKKIADPNNRSLVFQPSLTCQINGTIALSFLSDAMRVFPGKTDWDFPEEFFTWCKSPREDTSIDDVVEHVNYLLDLNKLDFTLKMEYLNPKEIAEEMNGGEAIDRVSAIFKLLREKTGVSLMVSYDHFTQGIRNLFIDRIEPRSKTVYTRSPDFGEAYKMTYEDFILLWPNLNAPIPYLYLTNE